jgi:hypothetical protein
MSEPLSVLNGEAKTPADTKPLTPAEQQVAQVNQVVSNAVAALMDIANLLRDIPKLVAVNVQLAERLGLSQSAQAEQEELKN